MPSADELLRTIACQTDPRWALMLAQQWMEDNAASVSQTADAAKKQTGRANGGLARAASLTPARRAEIARKAAQARWQAQEYTADPEQGVASNSPPPDDAPQAEGRAPPAPPELAAGAGDGTNQEPRSPAIPTSDSTEPVVPTGNEGRAGERGPEEDLEVTSYRASRSDEQETPAARAGHESCGGVESGHAEDHGGGEPAHVQQVAEAERTPSAERTASLSTIAEHPREAAGVAPGPQDLIKEVAHGDLAAPEPELARAVPPVTAPVYVAVVEMAGELVLTNELGAVAEAQPPRVAAPSETVDWDEIIASQPAPLRRVPA